MTAITLTRGNHGDLEMHLAGCADLKVRARHRHDGEDVTYEGDTLLAAINEADSDMAYWFGEKAYTTRAVDQGCWTTQIVEHAPCFVGALRSARILFDRATGRPSVADERKAIAPAATARRARKAVVVGSELADRCRGKWSTCGGKNPSRSAAWHLCEACTKARAAAKAAPAK